MLSRRGNQWLDDAEFAATAEKLRQGRCRGERW
jgi:hypothetical protein